MSNSAGAKTRREEELAFLAMEQVLDVDIRLADAGGGSKMPDGSWDTPTGKCIVEVTTPPATALMAEWARAKKEGRLQAESGCRPVRMNDLGAVCTELLGATWAIENITKLRAQPAEERHLFLFARSYDVGDYFYRLSLTTTARWNRLKTLPSLRGFRTSGSAAELDPAQTSSPMPSRYG